MKKFLFYFVQWTWGLSVNLIGGICCLVFKYFKKCRVERYGYNWFTYVPATSADFRSGFLCLSEIQAKKRAKSSGFITRRYTNTVTLFSALC